MRLRQWFTIAGVAAVALAASIVVCWLASQWLVDNFPGDYDPPADRAPIELPGVTPPPVQP